MSGVIGISEDRGGHLIDTSRHPSLAGMNRERIKTKKLVAVNFWQRFFPLRMLLDFPCCSSPMRYGITSVCVMGPIFLL